MRKLYFAYGTNLDPAGMFSRCEDATAKVARCYMLDYQLVFFDGLPTIVPMMGSRVYGAVYSISDDDEAALDLYEGYPNLYKKHFVTVLRPYRASIIHDVLVYVMNPGYTVFWPASDWVMQAMSRGYKYHDMEDLFYTVSAANEQAEQHKGEER